MAVIRPSGMNIADFYHVAQALVYSISTTGGLTNSAGTNTRPKNVNTIHFRAQASGGEGVPVWASLAATDPLPAFSGMTNLTAGQTCRVRVECDSAGTVTYKQGAITTVLGAAPTPRRTAGLATIGWIEIAVAAGFTFGTTSLGSTGVTFFDGDPDLGGLRGVNPSDRGISSVVIGAP